MEYEIMKLTDVCPCLKYFFSNPAENPKEDDRIGLIASENLAPKIESMDRSSSETQPVGNKKTRKNARRIENNQYKTAESDVKIESAYRRVRISSNGSV